MFKKKSWPVTVGLIALCLLPAGCNTSKEPSKKSEEKASEEQISKKSEVAAIPVFELKPDFNPKDVPYDSKANQVDVNLGHSQKSFLSAVWFQLKGEALPTEEESKWLSIWDKNPKYRRIDMAILLAQHAQTEATFSYSDPWVQQISLLNEPQKTVHRDLGAVCMYFFHCPDGVNGKMSWANNHAPGMKIPDPICKIKDSDSGYYNPNNAGFWKMELLDARYAGLQFFLLNTYGPDIEKDKLKPLQDALKSIDEMGLKNTVKLGLFDDTWTWGKPYFSKFWKTIPDMADPVACAELLYKAKWKPFFESLPRQHWYLYKGRPMIYFYNGGTIQHRENSDEVFRLMKELFAKDFGVEPYLCSDSAFVKTPEHKSADQVFRWFSIDKSTADSTQVKNGTSLTHAMVRWDATARSHQQKESLMTPKDLIHKDDTLLKKLLNDTHDKDLVVIATWNDLGEGTGINRCYDYFWNGVWQQPHVFMNLIRRSQAGETLP
jgi:hypothetical protein